jgi:predicted transcriptional regulator
MEETAVQEVSQETIEVKEKKVRKPRQDIKSRVIPFLESGAKTQSEISKELGVQQGAVFYTIRSLLKENKIVEIKEPREGKKDKVRYSLPS